MPTILDHPKITVIRPQGCLNATNAWEFERDIAAVLTKNGHNILLVDLASVESIDSAGLMALVSTLKFAGSLGQSFRICSVSPAIRIIFELTQLDQVFEICTDESLLVAS
jgi:anti-anti-sigma factor